MPGAHVGTRLYIPTIQYAKANGLQLYAYLSRAFADLLSVQSLGDIEALRPTQRIGPPELLTRASRALFTKFHQKATADHIGARYSATT